MDTRPSLRLLAAACIAAILAAAGAASAATFTFTHAGTASSGTIGGTAFGPTDFVITATGDTDHRTDMFYGFSISHRTARIDLEGVGSFRFLQPTQTFVVNESGLVGFGLTEWDLFDGPAAPAFTSYRLDSPIGPISGAGRLLQWDWAFGDVETSGGVLTIASGTSPATFQAVSAVPLPAAAPLLLSAFAALAFFLRRSGAAA